jgi:hypothetical protein
MRSSDFLCKAPAGVQARGSYRPGVSRVALHARLHSLHHFAVLKVTLIGLLHQARASDMDFGLDVVCCGDWRA